MKPSSVYNYILFCHGVYLGKSLIEASSSASHESSSNSLAESAKLSGNLNKSCAHSAEDCVFRLDHLLSYHEVYLDCINWQCTCRAWRDAPEELRWDLKWNGRDCLISKYGPCGGNSGLDVACQDDLLCIQSRCRNPRSFHTGGEGEICFDNVDCRKTLICKLDLRSRGKKTCESPAKTGSNKNPRMGLGQPLQEIIRYNPNPNPNHRTRNERINRFHDANQTQSDMVGDADNSGPQLKSYYRNREPTEGIKLQAVLKNGKRRKTSGSGTHVRLFGIRSIMLIVILWVIL